MSTQRYKIISDHSENTSCSRSRRILRTSLRPVDLCTDCDHLVRVVVYVRACMARVAIGGGEEEGGWWWWWDEDGGGSKQQRQPKQRSPRLLERMTTALQLPQRPFDQAKSSSSPGNDWSQPMTCKPNIRCASRCQLRPLPSRAAPVAPSRRRLRLSPGLIGGEDGWSGTRKDAC